MQKIQKIPLSKIENCFDTVVQLRTHLTLDVFVQRVKTQLEESYQMVGILEDNRYIAFAGYRFVNNLAWGKFLYCDDLVVHSDYRGRGLGHELMIFLEQEAKANGCAQFHLDSGAHRFSAHRLYLTHGMDITCHHFGKEC